VERTRLGAWTRRSLRGKAKRHVLVFVHGFNNKFEDAVFRFAQIVHDSGAEVAPVLFTWPSRGSVLAYGYDRESTNYHKARKAPPLRAGMESAGGVSRLANVLRPF